MSVRSLLIIFCVEIIVDVDECRDIMLILV